MELDSIVMEALLPLEILTKCQSLICTFLKRRKATPQEIQSLLNFACSVVILGRPVLRRLIDLTLGTVEPQFNAYEPLFNEVLDITNDILCPGQSYSKMYGIEPRYNEFFDITNIIRKPERRIYLDITNYNVNTRQKINAELINSQEIP